MWRPLALLCASVLSSVIGAMPSQAALNLTFTTIDFPGAAWTIPYGINRQDPLGFTEIVGSYGDITGKHGFLLAGGHYTTIDVPATLGKNTEAFGINDLGQIVGTYDDNASQKQGFVLESGTFTGTHVCFFGESGVVQAHGISNGGIIVGSYFNTEDQGNSQLAGAEYSTNPFHCLGSYAFPKPGANPPHMKATELYGVPTNQTVETPLVGYYADEAENGHTSYHGAVIYTGSGGGYTTLDYPGASDTWARGINNRSQIVGYFGLFDGDNRINEHIHGFMWSEFGGFDQIDYPGSSSTEVYGINNLGIVAGRYDIVGYFVDAEGTGHGFSARISEGGGSK